MPNRLFDKAEDHAQSEAAALAHLATAEANRLREAGQHRAAHFTWGRAAEGMRSAFEDALAGKRSSAR